MPNSSSRRRKGSPTAAQRAAALRLASLTRGEQLEAIRAQKMRDRRRQCVFADTLMVMGGLVGVSHGLEHAGVFTVYRLGLDDLIAGYPLAGLLIVFGLIKLPRRF